MPRNTVLTIDNGAHSFFAAHYWDTYRPCEFLSALRYVGPMGWAIGAGIGATFARPDAPGLVVTGDGCMLMNGMEIQTAARHKLNMIFAVFNNSAYGNPYLRARRVDEKAAALQLLPTHNWAAVAQALGAHGALIERPEQLKPAVEKALNDGGTHVLDIRCGHYPTPTESFDASLLKGLRRLD